MKAWRNIAASVAASVALLLLVGIGALRAQADLQAEAASAVDAWVAAVAGGDKDAVAAILAPEFQIVRDNGVAYDRDGYLASALPNIVNAPQFEDLHATSEGDVMVVRYVLVIDETIDGAAVEARAPRLTVFRRDGDTWLVSAHANFARIAR